jgi:hypothetical protein
VTGWDWFGVAVVAVVVVWAFGPLVREWMGEVVFAVTMRWDRPREPSRRALPAVEQPALPVSTVIHATAVDLRDEAR